jgi:hypothetical protein
MSVWGSPRLGGTHRGAGPLSQPAVSTGDGSVTLIDDRNRCRHGNGGGWPTFRYSSGAKVAQPEMIRALLAETGGITHRIMQCLNSAAIVAIHEGIERITADLLKVERAEPGRILAARRQLTDGSTRRESSASKKSASPSAIEARA